VNIRTFLPRLLSVLAILSLVTSPMAAPAVGETMGGAPMAAMENMADMAEGVPCCPPQKQPKPDCQQTCPLATLCVAKCVPDVQAIGASAGTGFVFVALVPVWDDAARDLHSDPPPPRPPRT
jgi:hypothetical protein